MGIERIGNGYVKIAVNQEDLEGSLSALSQLKLILQAQVIKSNGPNKRQAAIDVRQLGKHFDTAINAMTMLLSGFEEYQDQERQQGLKETDERHKNMDIGRKKLKFEECRNCEDWDGCLTNCFCICGKPIDALQEFNKYKDLEEQGLLIRLPCKFGDTVYVKMQSGEYAEAEVKDFTYFYTCGFCIVATSDKFDKQNIPFSEFGKSVFLTRPD